MLRLRAFGGLSIENAQFADAAVPRRPLTLLAMLAVAGERGLTRDKIIGLLWPESDDERARNSLSQALTSFKRQLGVDQIVLGTAELRLNSGVITSDVNDYGQLMEAGEAERALALYAGPFLDGVFLKDAPEFDRWVEHERRRLHRLRFRALETLAASATARGDYEAAVGWCRQRAEADPLDSRAALSHMRALAASGDPANALQCFDVHRSLLRAEMGIEPGLPLIAFASELRVAAPSIVPVAPNEPVEYLAVPRATSTTIADVPGTGRKLVITGGILLVALGSLGIWQAQRPAGAVQNRVVVAPFANHTHDSALADIGELVAAWLTDGLVKGAGTAVVPATTVRELLSQASVAWTPLQLARRTKATVLVSGVYAHVRDSLEYRAEVLNVADGSILASVGPVRGLASETAAFDSLQQRVAVVQELLREGRARRFNKWSQPRSMAALRLFNAAENNHFAHEDWSGAIPLYKRAHQLDTAWIAPLTQLSASYQNTGRGREADSVLDVARQLLLVSSWPGDQARVDWGAASHRSDYEAQYRAGRELLALDPIGEAYHAFVGAERTARYREARRIAERRDTTYDERRSRKSWDRRYLSVLHALSQFDDELRAASAIARKDLTNETASLVAQALAALGKSRDVDSLLTLVWGMPPDSAGPTTGYAPNTAASAATTAGWEYLAHGHGQLARAMFQKSLDWYLMQPAFAQTRWVDARAEALLLAGRIPDARVLYDSLVRATPTNGVRLAMLGITAVLLGDSILADSVDARLKAMEGPLGLHRIWRSRLAALRGDCTLAVGLLRSALPLGLARRNPPAETAHHRWAMYGKARSCPALLQLLAPRD